jgi:6-phosphogluconate dehydrogenase
MLIGAKAMRNTQPQQRYKIGMVGLGMGRNLLLNMADHGFSVAGYAQGLALLVVASDKYKYHLDLEAVARIWRGCILRIALLEDLCAAFRARRDLPNLLLDPNVSHKVMEQQENLRQVVCQAAQSGRRPRG